MDDVNHMDELRECVRLQSNGETECQKVAFALLVSTLFFELNCIPTFNNGKYHCQGAIRCRINGATVCETLTQLHPATLTFMTDNEVLGYFEPNQDLCGGCHRYNKNVEFVIRHPTEPTTLYLKSSLREKRKISGFSQNMLWFMTQQNLDSPFGWSNVDVRPSCDKCDFLQFSRLKRKVTPHQSVSGRKRIKLHWGHRFIYIIYFPSLEFLRNLIIHVKNWDSLYPSSKAEPINQLNLHITCTRIFVSQSSLFAITFASLLSCFKHERPPNENSEYYGNLLPFWQQQQQDILDQIRLGGDDSLMLKENMATIALRGWSVTDNCLPNNGRLRRTRRSGGNTLAKAMDGDRRKTCRYWKGSNIKSCIRREHFTCFIS